MIKELEEALNSWTIVGEFQEFRDGFKDDFKIFNNFEDF